MRYIKPIIYLTAALSLVGCASIENLQQSLATKTHVQLFNPWSSWQFGGNDEGAYHTKLGLTDYYIEGIKTGSKEEKRETAKFRTEELGFVLLNNWDKRGINPLAVLNRFDKDYDPHGKYFRIIDSEEYFNILVHLQNNRVRPYSFTGAGFEQEPQELQDRIKRQLMPSLAKRL